MKTVVGAPTIVTWTTFSYRFFYQQSPLSCEILDGFIVPADAVILLLRLYSDGLLLLDLLYHRNALTPWGVRTYSSRRHSSADMYKVGEDEMLSIVGCVALLSDHRLLGKEASMPPTQMKHLVHIYKRNGTHTTIGMNIRSSIIAHLDSAQVPIYCATVSFILYREGRHLILKAILLVTCFFPSGNSLFNRNLASFCAVLFCWHCRWHVWWCHHIVKMPSLIW